MKPARFLYRDPRSLDEALGLLEEHGNEAAVLAGGQSLLPLMNLRLVRPRVLIDVNRIPGLAGVDVGAGTATIGALARASALERDPRLGAALPALRLALRHVAHPQVRNRTTLGGSLAHADPSAELPAVLAAFDGHVQLASSGGERSLSWSEFFRGPFATARVPHELVVGASFDLPKGTRSAFLEISARRAAPAIVGACVALSRANGAIAEARIALCGVGGAPVRLREAEELLAGRSLDADRDAELGECVRTELDPPSDQRASGEYRRYAAATLVGRALARLWEEGSGGG